MPTASPDDYRAYCLTATSGGRTMRSGSGHLTWSGWMPPGWGGGGRGVMTSPGSANDTSGTDLALAVTDHTQLAQAGPDGIAGGDWAVCCSGGGIRSAAYCLGA